jgi:hypothetical protein
MKVEQFDHALVGDRIAFKYGKAVFRIHDIRKLGREHFYPRCGKDLMNTLNLLKMLTETPMNDASEFFHNFCFMLDFARGR